MIESLYSPAAGISSVKPGLSSFSSQAIADIKSEKTYSRAFFNSMLQSTSQAGNNNESLEDKVVNRLKQQGYETRKFEETNILSREDALNVFKEFVLRFISEPYSPGDGTEKDWGMQVNNFTNSILEKVNDDSIPAIDFRLSFLKTVQENLEEVEKFFTESPEIRNLKINQKNVIDFLKFIKDGFSIAFIGNKDAKKDLQNKIFQSKETEIITALMELLSESVVKDFDTYVPEYLTAQSETKLENELVESTVDSLKEEFAELKESYKKYNQENNSEKKHNQKEKLSNKLQDFNVKLKTSVQKMPLNINEMLTIELKGMEQDQEFIDMYTKILLSQSD